MIKSGTLTDKVAALTLMVQEGPVYRTRTLDALLAMAAKKGKREGTRNVPGPRPLRRRAPG